MPGIEEARRRLADEPAFRDRLITDPATALAGYDLTAADLEELAAAVGVESDGPAHRSTVLALFGEAFDLDPADDGPRVGPPTNEETPR